MPPDIYDLDSLVDPTPLRSRLHPKKRHRDDEGYDELSSAPFPQEHYVPRPSRSRATNNSQSADLLLIPEDYSKRPEALARKGRQLENKRRKVTESERVEISSGDGDDDDNDDGDDHRRTTEVRERKHKEDLHGEVEATPVTVTQRSDTTKSSTGKSTGSSRGGELKSSDVSGELKRAGERLFDGQGEGDRVNEVDGEVGQLSSGNAIGKELGRGKERRKRRNVIANSDDEEGEEDDDGSDGDVEGDGNPGDDDDDNDDIEDNEEDSQDKAEDFDFDDLPPVKPTKKPDKPSKKTKQELEDDEEEAYDEDDQSEFDDFKTTSKSKKKKGRPKKGASSSTTLDIAGTTPPTKERVAETTKKSRGRPKKKVDEPLEVAAPLPASKEKVQMSAPPTSTKSPRIEDRIDHAPPLSNTLSADPLYPPPISPPPPPVLQEDVPRTTTLSVEPKVTVNVVTDRQSSPMTSVNSANGKSPGLPGYRIGLSKAARIPSLLRVVRK